MTPTERAKLKTEGWTQVDGDNWRSPVTGRDLPERAALALVNLPHAKERHRNLYRPRYQRATRR